MADLEDTVRRIIAEQAYVPVELVTADWHLSDHLDSLDRFEVALSLEEEFNIAIDDDKVMEFETVQDLIDAVRSLMEAHS